MLSLWQHRWVSGSNWGSICFLIPCRVFIDTVCKVKTWVKLLNETVLNSHKHYRKMLLTPKKCYKISVVREKATI